jgi:hypothetical protein
MPEPNNTAGISSQIDTTPLFLLPRAIPFPPHTEFGFAILRGPNGCHPKALPEYTTRKPGYELFIHAIE